MIAASPGRLIGRHPLRSVFIASLIGFVLGHSATARRGLNIAADMAAVSSGKAFARSLDLLVQNASHFAAQSKKKCARHDARGIEPPE